MSARAPLSIEGRRPRPALVIDGEATRVSRSAATAPVEPAATSAEPAPSMPFDLHPRRETRSAFGRRSANRPPRAPDLIFQGDARSTGEAAAPLARRRGLSIFTEGALLAEKAGLGGTRDRRMAGLAAVLVLLALPVAILSAPIAPAEATPGTGPALAAPFVMDQLVTSIVPRGPGAVLTVQARIRNVSGHAAAVPTVRIALAETGGAVRSKSLLPAVASLPAGSAVRFHSTVAVAKDTRGAIEVGFLPPAAPSGKTLPE